jgi:hypothetical protein
MPAHHLAGLVELSAPLHNLVLPRPVLGRKACCSPAVGDKFLDKIE